MDGVKQQNIK